MPQFTLVVRFIGQPSWTALKLSETQVQRVVFWKKLSYFEKKARLDNFFEKYKSSLWRLFSVIQEIIPKQYVPVGIFNKETKV